MNGNSRSRSPTGADSKSILAKKQSRPKIGEGVPMLALINGIEREPKQQEDRADHSGFETGEQTQKYRDGLQLTLILPQAAP